MSEEIKNTEAVEETAKEEAPAVEVKETVVEKKEEGADVVVPAKFKDLVNTIDNMSVIDLHELVKLLEKKFGVSAAAVAVAGAPVAAAEEKTSFNVELSSAGDQKIAVIKVVKGALGLGLKEAKELVDAAPAMLKEKMKKEEAEALKAEIEAVGGKVELK